MVSVAILYSKFDSVLTFQKFHQRTSRVRVLPLLGCIAVLSSDFQRNLVLEIWECNSSQENSQKSVHPQICYTTWHWKSLERTVIQPNNGSTRTRDVRWWNFWQVSTLSNLLYNMALEITWKNWHLRTVASRCLEFEILWNDFHGHVV